MQCHRAPTSSWSSLVCRPGPSHVSLFFSDPRRPLLADFLRVLPKKWAKERMAGPCERSGSCTHSKQWGQAYHLKERKWSGPQEICCVALCCGVSAQNTESSRRRRRTMPSSPRSRVVQPVTGGTKAGRVANPRFFSFERVVVKRGVRRERERERERES